MITNTEYVLFVIGLLLIPIGVGLLLLAVLAWRIGTRMECSQNYVNVQAKYNSKYQNQKTYKPDEYSIDVLRDGK